MRKNVGTFDRIIRLVSSLVMGGMAIYFQNILGILAIYPFITAIIAWDPFYKITGIDTDL